MENRTNTLQTTSRSLDIIESIKRSSGATVSELVDELDMSRSTVHNHLLTLREKHYIVKEGNTYHIGLQFFHLGEHAITRKPSYEVISHRVKELANETDMEVDFSVEEFGRVIVIFDEMGSTIRKGFQLGQYYPIHACAAGKAILAQFPADRVDDILDTHGLPKTTENTITDRDRLLESLEQIRNRGYAINDEESNNGIRAVATTIQGPTGTILGGLSITDPAYRFPPHYEIGETLLEAADSLEDSIEQQWENRFKSSDI